MKFYPMSVDWACERKMRRKTRGPMALGGHGSIAVVLVTTNPIFSWMFCVFGFGWLWMSEGGDSCRCHLIPSERPLGEHLSYPIFVQSPPSLPPTVLLTYNRFLFYVNCNVCIFYFLMSVLRGIIG